MTSRPRIGTVSLGQVAVGVTNEVSVVELSMEETRIFVDSLPGSSFGTVSGDSLPVLVGEEFENLARLGVTACLSLGIEKLSVDGHVEDPFGSRGERE